MAADTAKKMDADGSCHDTEFKEVPGPGVVADVETCLCPSVDGTKTVVPLELFNECGIVHDPE